MLDKLPQFLRSANFASLLIALYRQVQLLVVLTVIMLAAYVSVGRVLMPGVAAYTDFFEQQITTLTGLQVTIDSLEGSFANFSPVLQINGLQVLVEPAATAPGAGQELTFESAVLGLDMVRSLWQRQWVIKDFVVESLELELRQQESGQWQISGLGAGEELSRKTGTELDPEQLYQNFLRVTRLKLNDLLVTVQPYAAEPFQLQEVAVMIQNSGNEHLLHFDFRLGASTRPISLSVEARGSSLASLSGQILPACR